MEPSGTRPDVARPAQGPAPVLDLLALLRSSAESARGSAHLPARQRSTTAEGYTVLVDASSGGKLACVTVLTKGPCRLRLAGVEGFSRAPFGGYMLRTAGVDAAAVWLPGLPRRLEFDRAGRLLHVEALPVQAADFTPTGPELTLEADEPWCIELVAWCLSPAVAMASATLLEQAAWYTLGSHTALRGRADVYLHLHGGTVFENRTAWPNKWRVFSENDAHALHLVLGGLAVAGGDPLLRALRDQVLLSVLERQSPDGGFRHGEWTQTMESHYRLHCSAMHLMMDVLAESANPQVSRALAAAAAFLARQAIDLDIGKWLLHDELEHSVAQMRLGPFKWVPSTALGKAESNMLVLNSHLDGLVALDRYAAITGDRQFGALVVSARETTRRLLSMRSAETLYRAVMWLVEMTFLPAPQAAALPMWKRALKRLTWQYLIPRLPDLKARFPRLVMPGGYIDRELTLRTWAHDYHAINLMDLARYLRRFDCPVVRQVLVEGLAFTCRSGILERWREMPYQKYALGFWAEALYHVCSIFPDAQYRQWLAEAMLVLEELQMGQPPSLLGANAEAVPVADQLPCPSPANPRLRVANLGRRGAPELLIVNPSDEANAVDWEIAPAFAVEFHTGAQDVLAQSPLRVPARGWLWGRAAE